MPVEKGKTIVAPYQAIAGQREFTITRIFHAPKTMVFKAWTDPKQIAQWWGPHGFNTSVCEMDLRIGGAYRIVMRGPDGAEYPMKGFYQEIVENQRLVYTADLSEHPQDWWNMVAPDRRTEKPIGPIINTITFDEHDGKTTLTIRMAFESSQIRDAHVRLGMADGWSQSFEKMDELLASRSPTADREIKISRIVDAPRELVWNAMTDPAQVIHWWGPRGFTTTIETMDVNPGGHWNYVMHGPDGTDYPNYSVFREVLKPQRLVFTQGGAKKGGPEAQFVGTWTFDELAPGKTQVTIHMVFPTAAARDTVVKQYGAIEGGKQTLQRLTEHLAKSI
jgi:uncharacterized protein YndB with AHSA1/START domain